jgi:spermidine synthase
VVPTAALRQPTSGDSLHLGLLYPGVALVAGATIVYEVALTRIFSIAYGYHFAFLAMSLGLLGFGVSGTLLALRPGWRQGLTGLRLGWLAAAASLTFAGGYLVANNIPLDPYRVGWDPGQLPLLCLYLAVFALPFLLTGLIQGLPITSWPVIAGRVYAASLIGSGLGGLAALVALDRLTAPGALTGGAAVAAAAAVVLAGAGPRRTDEPWWVLGALSIAICIGLAGITAVQPVWLDVRMSPYKPLPQMLQFPDAKVALSESSSEALVDVVDSSSVHSAPGLSFGYQGAMPEQSAAVVDGDRVIPLTPVDQLGPDFLQALPSSLAYRLRPGADVLVLDPGAGLEVAAALDGRAESVVAVEGNSLLAGLFRGPLAERTGRVFEDPRVKLVGANPRAHLAGSSGDFDVISLALSENRRSVTAGAFSLSENFLMTREAFDTYFSRLRPDGLLVLHRWLQLPPTEELRAASLLVESLRDAGRHIVAIRSFSTMLMIAKAEPLEAAEVAAVKAFAEERQFDLVHVPGMADSESNRFNVLRDDQYTDSFRDLLAGPESLYRNYEYEVRAPTDDRPFFFHFFKWSQIPTVLSLMGTTWQPFGGSGYLVVLGLLAVITLLSALLILLPVAVSRRREERTTPKRWGLRAGVYFAMLGLGFLMIEVALVGRLLLILDHSALAFTIVLFGLLTSSGVGSVLSPRIPWRAALGALVALTLLMTVFLSGPLGLLLRAPLPLRIAGALAVLAPLGLLMGVAFPKGLQWVAAERASWLPMAWSVNGFTSVIGAVLAALVSLSWGYSVVLGCGGAAYLIALLTIWRQPALSPEP